MKQAQLHNGKTAGIISVIAGTVSVAGPLVPFGFIVLPVAIISSIVALRTNKQKKLAWIGISLTCFAIVLWLIIIVSAIIMSHEPND